MEVPLKAPTPLIHTPLKAKVPIKKPNVISSTESKTSGPLAMTLLQKKRRLQAAINPPSSVVINRISPVNLKEGLPHQRRGLQNEKEDDVQLQTRAVSAKRLKKSDWADLEAQNNMHTSWLERGVIDKGERLIKREIKRGETRVVKGTGVYHPESPLYGIPRLQRKQNSSAFNRGASQSKLVWQKKEERKQSTPLQSQPKQSTSSSPRLLVKGLPLYTASSTGKAIW
jgi:hypothetical protein